MKKFFLLLSVSMLSVCSWAQSSVSCDVNNDGDVSVTDVFVLVDLLLSGGDDSACDLDDDGEVSLSDVFVVVDYIFKKSDKDLKIWLTDGNVVNINLDDQPVTTYSDGVLTITTTKTTISYPLEEVSKYTYASAQGIESINGMKPQLSQHDDAYTSSEVTQDTGNTVNASHGKVMRTEDLDSQAEAAASQDALVVFFNDGNFRKLYMKDIVEISTSKTDENDVSHNDYQYQVVATKGGAFYYDLSNVNCIVFSKYDDEKAEQNFVNAMPEVVEILSDCETIGEAEAQIEQIKEHDGVEDVWSDGHKLYVKIEEGETFSFHFHHDADADNTLTESYDYQGLANSLLSKVKTLGASSKSNLKVAIADQQYKDEDRVEDRVNYIEPLIKTLRDCGIYVDDVTDGLTVDFFYDNSSDPEHLHIYDYDIIVLLTHGAYLQPRYLLTKDYDDYEVAYHSLMCHSILTSEEIVTFPKKGKYDENWIKYYSDFVSWRNGTRYRNVSDIDIAFEFNSEIRGGEECWVGYPVLTEYFFRDIATGRFPDNSILFNSACQSLMGDSPDQPSFSFAQKLFDKNLAIYLGYTESNIFGRGILPQFVMNMFNKDQSLGFVYDELPLPYKHETIENIKSSVGRYGIIEEDIQRIISEGKPYGAELLIVPNESEEARNHFLFGVFTNIVDQNDVSQEYDTDKAISVSATLTAHSPNEIHQVGFEYGTDDKNLSSNQDASFSGYIENQGKGNCKFVAKLKDLEANKTYYYRAYTYDSKYYNYGNLESFTTYEKLTLSTNSITVSALTSSSVQIISGSGSYEVESVVPSGVVTASIVDNSIVAIEALTAGPAMITVKDTKSGQTATIEVTVTQGTNPVSYLTCPDDHHPHLIDLGLPSGTKWACCNVADNPAEQAPTSYGTYYAWGETSGKDYYDWSTYIHCDGSSSTCHDLGSDIAGTQYDVAHVRWGGSWVMPSMEQQDELINNCTSEWTTVNGVNGRIFKGSNGGSIFLPAAGYRWHDVLYLADSYGGYWSSTQYSSSSYYAYCLYFYSDLVDCYYGDRVYGQSVRPVSR